MAKLKQIHRFAVERQAAGFSSQEAVAKVLGVTRQAVSFWERGVSIPMRPTRILISQVLNVPTDEVDRWFVRPAKKAA